MSDYQENLENDNLFPQLEENIFERFGAIELVQLPLDETGLCKGFAFVQFSRVEDAKAALTLNGQLDIGGRFIKVSAVTDQPGMQDMGATNGDLDGDEGFGLALNAGSRAFLIQRLDRSGSAPRVVGVNTAGLSASSADSAPMLGSATVISPMLGGMPNAGFAMPPVAFPTVEAIGIPSECLLLKNMFDPRAENEPDFDLDIRMTFKMNALDFSEGHVYLKFDNTQAAMNAQQALHGRCMLPQNYEDKFPESR